MRVGTEIKDRQEYGLEKEEKAPLLCHIQYRFRGPMTVTDKFADPSSYPKIDQQSTLETGNFGVNILCFVRSFRVWIM